MLALALSAAMLGIDGYVVRVEADSAAGTPSCSIIGLPDRAIAEARERVRAAIVNSGFLYPPGRLLINLSPADVRKEGPAFDLAIALALLALDERVDRLALGEFVALGELALDGGLRAVAGLLPMIVGARNAGFRKLLVPAANLDEALLIEDLEIYAVPALADAVAVVLGHGAKWRRRAARAAPAPPGADPCAADFSEVRGQHAAKRALEIAAAGGHNALLVGPPGCGKTMLAQRLPSILPAMTRDEALEVTKIYSVAGLFATKPSIATRRPFRAPHHSISHVALAGGGAVPKPGEISLAHAGVLFLDEFFEFSRGAIEAMRQPLEDGTITIARAAGTFTYPARYILVAAMNPCPCGYRGSRTRDCRCDDATVARYAAKLSGPLLDRIDLQIDLERVDFDDLVSAQPAEPSAAIRARVEAARRLQHERYAGTRIACNAHVPAGRLRVLCALDGDSTELLKRAFARGAVSARGFDRITRVARTIADLAGNPAIGRAHVAEALRLRPTAAGAETAAALPV